MAATVTEDVREQVLGVVRQSQELTLDAIKQVVETVNTAAEKLPAVPFAGRLPSRPATNPCPPPNNAQRITPRAAAPRRCLAAAARPEPVTVDR